MIGTFASFAWLMASTVCGMTPSTADTTSTTMSVTCAPRARILVNASWPGVSMKTMRPRLVSTLYAPMCWVMPPYSPSATFAERMASSSFVLPWSTCPITVTMGARRSTSSSLPFSSSMTVSSYSETTLILQSNSAASSCAVSESICWFSVTIVPMAMSLWMRSEPLRFIFLARSETVMAPVIEISFGTGFAMMTVFFLTLRLFSSGSACLRFSQSGLFLPFVKNFLPPPAAGFLSSPGFTGAWPGRGGPPGRPPNGGRPPYPPPEGRPL